MMFLQSFWSGIVYVYVAKLWSWQNDSLMLAWELRQEFNNVQQRILFVTGKDIQGFSPILLNEIKMDA
jgi:hypothetical protein